MKEFAARTRLTERMYRAALLETSLYNEVEADVTATSQALTVVVLTGIASGIGAALGEALSGRPGGILIGLIGGVVGEIIAWLVWSYVMYLVGTRVFHGTATYGELLRTLGFAYSPGVLLILRFIPVLGGLISLGVVVWRIVAGFIAIREALDLDTGNTVATIVIGVVAYIVVFAILGVLLALFGLSAAVLTGGFR